MERAHPKENLEVSVSLFRCRFLLNRQNNLMIFTGWSGFACAARGSKVIKEFHVSFVKIFPFFWNVIFVINRFNRADRFSCAAIHALIWLDVQHSIAFINTIDWTLFDTRFIFNIDTRFRDYVGHRTLPFFLITFLPICRSARWIQPANTP